MREPTTLEGWREEAIRLRTKSIPFMVKCWQRNMDAWVADLEVKNNRIASLEDDVERLESEATAAPALKEALEKLEAAASPYEADQSGVSDPRVGAVQPVSVAEGNALNDALGIARAALALLEPEQKTPCPSCGREQDHVGGTQETPFCENAFHVFGESVL